MVQDRSQDRSEGTKATTHPPTQPGAAPAKGAAPAEEQESRADKAKRVLEHYRHNLQHNAPRSDAELKDLEDLLGG